MTGEHVRAWDPDAIARTYDAAKADIADPAGASTTEDADEPWPETEAIDVGSIRPPAGRGAGREPARPSCPRGHEAPPLPTAPDAPAASPRRRAWRRWFSGPDA
jgi:hypothetical protein